MVQWVLQKIKHTITIGSSNSTAEQFNFPKELKAGTQMDVWVFFFNIYLFILAVPGLSCGTRDLRCDMQTP